MLHQKLTQECVRELFDYNPDTGILTCKHRVLSKNRVSVKSGQIAGWVESNGYRYVKINYNAYCGLHALIVQGRLSKLG